MMAGSAGGAVPVTSYLLLPPLPSSLFRAALSPPAISALYKARNPQAVMMEEFVETRASCMSTAVARTTCGLQYEKCRHGHDRRQNCPKCSCPGESACCRLGRSPLGEAAVQGGADRSRRFRAANRRRPRPLLCCLRARSGNRPSDESASSLAPKAGKGSNL